MQLGDSKDGCVFDSTMYNYIAMPDLGVREWERDHDITLFPDLFTIQFASGQNLDDGTVWGQGWP